jgi:cytochrome c-type biogenesis protein CcmH
VKIIPVLLLALLCGPALAQENSEDARYRDLIQELRCLVCQNQNIADSDAPLASDLRQQVKKQIAEGRSDAEIKRYLTDRYGDFVLYKPPLKGSTLLLWIGPFVLLLFALAVALRLLLGRRARPAPAAAPDPERLRRLLDEDRP